jgi:branched-chain amino acid transport system ATP-binding protein
MSGDIILETEDLTKEFAGFVAVNGVTLRVARGTIHALIGPNGAGKTTCFNLLTKFLQPTRWPHCLQGPGHHGASADRDCSPRPGALVPDFSGVSASHLPREHPHRFAAQARRLVRFLALQTRCSTSLERSRDVSCSAMSGLAEFANLTAVELPYGRKRALELATTDRARSPRCCLLDEPTAGMGH